MAVVSEITLKEMLKQYRYRDLAVRDITMITSHYKDLKPVMDAYEFNDGSSRDLMSLTGTIPVCYRGNVYNIPLCVWLLETYPSNAPICFVKPTSVMMIKTGKTIDSNGKVYLPYLHNWKSPRSDLYGLIQVMIVVFGEQPPVFSRPTTQPPYQAAGPPILKQGIPGISVQSIKGLETEPRSQYKEIPQIKTIQQMTGNMRITLRNESSTRHSRKIKELLSEPNIKNIDSLYFYKDAKYMLGSGASSTQVYIGMRTDGTEVAVKIITKNPRNNKDFENELKLLQDLKLESKNIVRYVTCAEDKDFYYLANQLCEYDLEDYLEYLYQPKQKDRKETTLRRIVEEMLRGLQVLHRAGVVHRDIKPRNVLIDKEERARLADFGISRKLEEGKTTVYTDRAGTQGWEATEIVNQTEKGRYKMSSDIQVAGMLTCYILFDRKHPFGNGIRRELNISEGEYNTEDIKDKAAKDLIEWMINKEQDKRPTIDKVLNHPYFWADKRKEEVIKKVGDRPEVQNYIDIFLVVTNRKDGEGLTEAVERVCKKGKERKILLMLGETEEVQNQKFEELSRLSEYSENCTKGKTFNNWKSELPDQLKPIDPACPEDLIGLLRTYRNKWSHEVGINKEVFDQFPDFYTSLYRLALDMDWDCFWS